MIHAKEWGKHLQTCLSDSLEKLTKLENDHEFFMKYAEAKKPFEDIMKYIDALCGEEGAYEDAEIVTLCEIEEEIKELTSTIKKLEVAVLGVQINTKDVFNKLRDKSKENSENDFPENEIDFEEAIDKALDSVFNV